MNYFSRSTPSLSSLQQTLSDVSNSLEKFYSSPLKDDSYIRLHSSTLNSEELLAFNKAFLEGSITLGSYNDEYQSLASSIFQSNFCVSSNSGSSANLLAISALVQSGRLDKGDKVLVPALAWSTSVFPLVQYGLIPIYIDISPDDFNLSIEELNKACVEHSPKCLLLIHTYGNPADMDKIMQLCSDYDMLLVEDTCESMGASWDNKPVGSFGIAGTFSSYYSHHICTLEGGLTITNDSELNNLMQSIRSHGWTRGIDFDLSEIPSLDSIDPTFLFLNVGYNLRLSDPQASIGIQQLKKLSTYVESRIKVADRFIKNIHNSAVLSRCINYPSVNPKAKSSWFGFPVVVADDLSFSLKNLREYLAEKSIESRPFLAGNFALQPVNSRFDHIVYNNTPTIARFHSRSFALPCHQDITNDNVDYMCSILEGFFNGTP